MKRTICLILILSALFGLVACQAEEPLKDPVNFYYHRIETQFGKENGVIDVMVVEGSGKKDDYLALLNEYLRGINDSTFSATFPTSTRITELSIQNNTAYLIMNPVLGQYSGMALTIACACLTLTTIELTGVQRVSIRINNGTLNGSDEIIMDKDSILLLDAYQPEQTQD